MKQPMHRVMLKLSGEVFKGETSYGLSDVALDSFAQDIAKMRNKNIVIAITLGGGNIWRYRDWKHLPLERSDSDYLGMLATVINAVSLQAALKHKKVKVSAYSRVQVPQFLPFYDRHRVYDDLADGKIVILAGGTGNPYFTTDSAAALNALELHCDIFLKATKVDYVYDKDPVLYPNARAYKKLRYLDVIQKGLAVMDLTAIALCREGKLPIRVFNIHQKGALSDILHGKDIGTFIS